MAWADAEPHDRIPDLAGRGAGGLDTASGSSTAVERYDPRTRKWTTVASLHQSRRAPGVTVVERGHDTLVVAVGGCETVAGTNVAQRRTTEVYSLRTGRWRTLTARIPGGRCSLGAATTAGGTVLAIGGATAFPTVVATAEVLALRP
ncbi:hypothetical protein [Actinoplanes sp. NPDC023714]|uniref:hypothetical protein n=1 Tax=Actinoplanes sp. NPDC023714 TaxID=3154322 RepID=UPI0033DFE6F5